MTNTILGALGQAMLQFVEILGELFGGIAKIFIDDGVITPLGTILLLAIGGLIIVFIFDLIFNIRGGHND